MTSRRVLLQEFARHVEGKSESTTPCTKRRWNGSTCSHRSMMRTRLDIELEAGDGFAVVSRKLLGGDEGKDLEFGLPLGPVMDHGGGRVGVVGDRLIELVVLLAAFTSLLLRSQIAFRLLSVSSVVSFLPSVSVSTSMTTGIRKSRTCGRARRRR